MGAPGLTTALRADTFDNLQLNAGVILKNFSYDSAADAAALKTAIASAITAGNILGATRGGGEFKVTRETRTPDIDGKRYSYKGGTFVDSADAYLTATLVEVTPDNIKVLLGTGTATTSGKKTTVKMRTAIDDTDYLTNLCWAGDLSDGRLALIVLKNAFNTADFTLTFKDKDEGTLAAEFHAHQANFDDYDYAPFEVVFFETDGTLGTLTVTSEAGTNVGGTAITVNHTLTGSEAFVYKFDTIAPSIGYHEAPDYTWTAWDGSSDIDVGAANNGKRITIALLNGNGKVEASGNATLAVKTA